VSDIFALVAEPSRREILSLLWRGERCASDVAARMPVTFGAVSQHLRVLREAGVLQVRKEGRKRFYRVRREALGPLASALEQMWAQNLRRLKATAEAEEKRDVRAKRSR
jgi:DNA-binding transcriptional ArsR family regulator